MWYETGQVTAYKWSFCHRLLPTSIIASSRLSHLRRDFTAWFLLTPIWDMRQLMSRSSTPSLASQVSPISIINAFACRLVAIVSCVWIFPLIMTLTLSSGTLVSLEINFIMKVPGHSALMLTLIFLPLCFTVMLNVSIVEVLGHDSVAMSPVDRKYFKGEGMIVSSVTWVGFILRAGWHESWWLGQSRFWHLTELKIADRVTAAALATVIPIDRSNTIRCSVLTNRRRIYTSSTASS